MIKRAKLEALGLICRHFPVVMVLSRLAILTELLTVPEAKEEDQALTGRLEGLQHALHVAKFVVSSDRIKKIYSQICTILKSLDELARYHQPLAALELFAAHSDLFKEALVDPSDPKGCVDVCRNLLKACVHANKDVHSKALKAYDAWLGCIRHRLAADAHQNWAKDALVSMIEELNTYLSKPDARSRCISLRGFGSFAAPIKATKGEEYLARLWADLTSYMTSILGHGDEDSREEASQQLPSLIVAFCGLLSEMSQVRADAHINMSMSKHWWRRSVFRSSGLHV